MKTILITILSLFIINIAFAQQARRDTIVISSEPNFKTKAEKSRFIKKEDKHEVVAPNWLQKKYAEMLEVLPEEIKNLSLYNFIEEWYGTRYVYGGTTKRGIDCSAFVQKMTSSVFNTEVVRTAASQFQETEFVNRDQLQEGDLVFFKVKVSRISHVGVYLQNNRFVHASSSRGVMISNLNDSYWSRYYAGGGRLSVAKNL